MKKKLLVLLIILVLAASMVVATACNDTGMITKNQERNLKQVTAEITYAGRAAQVDKLELNQTIYNFVYQYYSYYQQGYLSQATYQGILDNIETSYDNANESSAQSEAYTLYCIEQLYQKVVNGTDADKKAKAIAASTVNKAYNMADRIAEIESVLDTKNLIKAVEAYNEEMQEAFDSYREAYEKEVSAANVTNKSSDDVKELKVTAPWKVVYEKGETLLENGLKVVAVFNDGTETELKRSEYTVTGFSSDEVKAEQEVTVTYGNTTKTFNVEIIAAKPSRPALPKDEDEEEKTVVPALFDVDLAAKIAAAKTTDPEEYKTLKEAERRLAKQMESNYRSYSYYYLSKLKTQVVTAYEEIVGEEALKVSQATVAEISAEYQKQLKQQEQELVVGTKKFSSVLDSSDIKSQIVRADDEAFYVRHFLLKITDDLQAQYDEFKDEKVANDEALNAYLNKLINRTKVYISNPDYDKDAKCEKEECDCSLCENYSGTEKEHNPDCTCEKCPNKRFLNSITYAGDKELVADENGTYDILAVKEAAMEDLKALKQSGATATEMLKAFDKWTYMCNDDSSYFDVLTGGKLGYELSMTDSSYVKNFTALARALAYGSDDLDNAEWKFEGTGVGAFGWCYTEYGIHVLMLSGYALDTEEEGVVDLENGYYSIPETAIVDYANYEVSEDGYNKGTLIYEIKEKLLSDKKENAVAEVKKTFYQKTIDQDATIVYHKVYQDLIDQYNK